MADYALPTTTMVLRKRKRAKESLVLRISSSPSPSYDPSHTESEYETDVAVSDAPGSSNTILREARIKEILYKCSHEGCSKAYSKPSRLAEHQRSHTGDRPFVCSICQKAYFRDCHLQAHTRTHLPESAKPFVCEEPDCGRRFWTAQHLHVHEKLHRGEKPFKCSEPLCDASFAKNHQLRAHICTVHAPPGTKPYRCEHAGCAKSFTTSQKLRAHIKIHDDKRYTCVHRACLPPSGTRPTYFPTWSALQHHMRTVHPPTCPHASCNGKTFTAQKGLRAHLRIHAERDLEAELDNVVAGSADEEERQPLKRRRGGEVGRDWVCEEAGCKKDFKSRKALATHHKVTHQGRRDFVCPHLDCRQAFGYKHLLQRHTAKVHQSEIPSSSESEGTDDSDNGHTEGDAEVQPVFDISLITGSAYATRAQAQLSTPKTLQCPFPHLPPSLVDEAMNKPDEPNAGTSRCQYVFSRAYDFRRHMHAEHGIDAEKEKVDRWVRHAKQVKAGESSHN